MSRLINKTVFMNKCKKCVFFDSIILSGNINKKHFCKNKQSTFYSNYLTLKSNQCDKFESICTVVQ